MVDRIRDTCESHVRCNVVEVMGRGSGELALHSGLAVGATAIIIKEIFYDEDAIVKKILQGKSLGKRSFIIVVSENMGSDFAEKFYKRIEEKTGIPTRFARLAHVQRGGVPTCRDRNIASKMGYKAVELLCEGKSNLVICYEAGMVYGMEINFALKLDRL